MTYNLTGIANNATGLLSYTTAINDTLMNGHLGFLLLISLGVVMFGSFFYTSGDVPRSTAATMFILFILSLFLRAVNLLPDIGIIATTILFAASVAFIWKRQ